MPLAGDKEFKLKSLGGNFTSKRYCLVTKHSLIVLGREIPEAGMKKKCQQFLNLWIMGLKGSLTFLF